MSESSRKRKRNAINDVHEKIINSTRTEEVARVVSLVERLKKLIDVHKERAGEDSKQQVEQLQLKLAQELQDIKTANNAVISELNRERIHVSGQIATAQLQKSNLIREANEIKEIRIPHANTLLAEAQAHLEHIEEQNEEYLQSDAHVNRQHAIAAEMANHNIVIGTNKKLKTTLSGLYEELKSQTVKERLAKDEADLIAKDFAVEHEQFLHDINDLNAEVESWHRPRADIEQDLRAVFGEEIASELNRKEEQYTHETQEGLAQLKFVYEGINYYIYIYIYILSWKICLFFIF